MYQMLSSDRHDPDVMNSDSASPPDKKSVLSRRLVLGAAMGTLLIVGGCGGGDSHDSVSSGSGSTDPANVAASTSQSVPNARMQAVLDQLVALGAKPIET